MLRKICVVTGTRAEYGLLAGLMQEIQRHPALALQVVACAAHLSEKQGMTVNAIREDGFQVDAEVPMPLQGDDDYAIAQAVAEGVSGFADAFRRLDPDMVVVLGDRYEILAAVQSALFMHVPIAHIHGGEVTEGAIDDALRHAITKMANWHFTAAEPYRRRVIQMGERPETVFNVGAPGLDRVLQLSFLSKGALEKDLGLKLGSPLFLVTYHPVTWGEGRAGSTALENLFKALEHFEGATVIWTGANADAGGEALNEQIRGWMSQTRLQVRFAQSLGSLRYLSLMALCDAVVGNSSSGIIEAPMVGVPTVNVGSRQQGRLRSPSVVDTDESTASIIQGIERALSPAHQKLAARKDSVYGQGNSAQRICEQLAAYPFDQPTGKSFYDLPGSFTTEQE